MTAPIAIVGQACLLPDALDVSRFADNVFAGHDAVSEVDPDRWEVPVADVLGEGRDRTWSTAGGYVRGFERVWDPSGFRVPASELVGLDPLVHWIFHVGRAALRDAGLDVGHRALGRCGAILGNLSFPSEGMARWGERVTLGANGRPGPAADPRDRFMSGLPVDLLARGLGLGGASFALDAACASSLYAIRLACDALAAGRADIMLAGAVQRADSLFLHIGFCALGALSHVGKSRPFHRGADGLVPAEGAALVVLKRLDDAVRDGDRILGVIRGVGLSNDARARNLLAPSEEGQVRALRAAYQSANLDPREIQLVECHATGTPTGDRTEIATLAEVFGNHPLPVGSLKSMVGHLITAAGAAGLLKVLAGFARQTMPPTLHGDDPIPAFADVPFRLLTAPEPWDAPVRRAAVSAFGFGGNNAHLIVEEHVPNAPMAVAFSRRKPVAVVGIAVAAGTGSDRADYAQDLLGRPAHGPRRESVELALAGLRFPPKDLGLSLPQQTLLLRVALDAVAEAKVPTPRERTGVYVGMGADVAVSGYGLRWRLGARTGATGADLDTLRDAVIPALRAENVVGTMPNIPANRLNVQLDAGGPGFTVSAEELSGVHALAVAADAVASGVLDVALVGAVDLACDPRHVAALAALAPGVEPGDAAVALVLAPADDAERAGLPIWAVLESIESTGAGAPPLPRPAGPTLSAPPALGSAHAASGLLDVAAAVLAVAHGQLPGGAPLPATEGARRASTWTQSIGGATARVVVSASGAARPLGGAPRLAGHLLTFPAHAEAIVLPPARSAASAAPSTSAAPATDTVALRPGVRALKLPLPPSLPPVLGDFLASPPAATVPPAPAPQAAQAVPAPDRRAQTTPQRANGATGTGVGMGPTPRPAPTVQPAPMVPPAPALQAARAAPVPLPDLRVQPAPPRAAALGSPAPAHPSNHASRPPMHDRDPNAPADPVLAALLANQARVTQVHRAFLQSQVAVQTRFAESRAATTRMLVTAAGGAPAHVAAVALSAPPARPPAFSHPTPAEPATASPGLIAGTPTPVHAPPTPPTTSIPTVAPVVTKPATPTPVAPRSAAAPTPAAAPGGVAGGLPPAPKATAPSPTPTGPLPGPKLSRADLVELSRGPVSKFFGPQFAPQDAYARVVRMPEPPLLLCDRVTGIDGPPGKLGKGSIWTETDVTADAWYLHDRRIPAGVMIESGQADLLLVSWQGIDVSNNKGERMYRLLGCDLRYEGGLPQVGDTLRYEIQVDGHAKLGDIRMFFFHYDCRVGDDVRLTVREGQAGFFSEAELANSGGVLWDAATAEVDLSGPLAPPAVQCAKRAFDRADLVAFTEGRVRDCFGPSHGLAETHTHTPRIAGGRMLFFDRVTEFDAQGGPWKRGYLKAEADITPDKWFFDGHFFNDPCMPGTLMFEGCLQALQVYMTALGHTLTRDGWRFEPRQGETFHLRCRGQVIPTSKLLTYELFVQEVGLTPTPYVKAQVMCTVDGLKCFHADPLTLVMVPDWPLTRRPELLADYKEPKPCVWDYASLLACAWGRPSDAFGPMYKVFDGTRRVARLPGPPYHFMSRVTKTDGAIGVCKAGAVIELEYDVPMKEWYFRENGNPTMPFAVLLEAALQPCGWLASYVGSALTSEGDLLFRNLDGSGTLLKEIRPDAGTLTTRVKITSVNRSAGMIIESFDVTMYMHGEPLYVMKTVFGFFPPAAFENQVGVGSEEADRAWLAEPNDFRVDLTARPDRYCGGKLRMPAPMLCMLDRVTGRWETGGKAGLGKWRAEKDVEVTEWFFKAHFYQDPVQPGSLGIEAMIQLAQFVMIHEGYGARFEAPRFEPIAIGAEMKWKYRGQVVPKNKLIQTEIEVVRKEDDALFFDCHLWVDGKRIYSSWNLGMRVVEGAGQPQFPFDDGGDGGGG